MIEAQNSHILIKVEKYDFLKHLERNRVDQDYDETKLQNKETTVLTEEDYKCLKNLVNKFEEESNLSALSQSNDFSYEDSISTTELNEHSIQVKDLQVLYLNDKRNDNNSIVTCSLHDLLTTSKIYFLQNEKPSRNIFLEERCINLKIEEDNMYYKFMTRFIDRPGLMDEGFACQIQNINKQLLGIGQCILSVICGFVFGFFGLEYFVGAMNLGLKLMIGLLIAFIVAVAELYFFINKVSHT